MKIFNQHIVFLWAIGVISLFAGCESKDIDIDAIFFECTDSTDEPFDYTKYDGIKNACYSIALNEKFFNNDNKWERKKHNKYIRTVEDGVLNQKSLINTNYYFFFTNNNIEIDSDYQLDVDVLMGKGDPDKKHVITFSGKDNFAQYYAISIDKNKNLSIFKEVNDKKTTFLDTKALSINPSDWNKITLRKINQEYFFFINETFVYTVNFAPFGDQFALTVPANSENQIDNLLIRSIRKK